MPHRIPRRPLLAAALALPGVARAADAWPTRPVRVVISWPPGGGADIPMRLAAPAMQQVLGQPLVLENRAGARTALVMRRARSSATTSTAARRPDA